MPRRAYVSPAPGTGSSWTGTAPTILDAYGARVAEADGRSAAAPRSTDSACDSRSTRSDRALPRGQAGSARRTSTPRSRWMRRSGSIPRSCSRATSRHPGRKVAASSMPRRSNAAPMRPGDTGGVRRPSPVLGPTIPAMGGTRTDPANAPAEVRAAALRRSEARAARDWGTADELRGEIEAAGWRVTDSGTEFRLRRRIPPTARSGVRFGMAAATRCRAGWTMRQPASRPWSWPSSGATRRPLASVTAATRAAADGRGAGRRRRRPQQRGSRCHSGRPRGAHTIGGGHELVRTSAPLGRAAALNAGIRRASGAVVVVLDSSVQPTGDAVSPLVAALEAPEVAVAGPFGLETADLRTFEEVVPHGDDPVTRRPSRATAWRSVAPTTSSAARSTRASASTATSTSGGASCSATPGTGEPRAARVAVPNLPVTRSEPSAWTSTPPRERDRLSKRNFYRVLERFRDRPDLVVPATGRRAARRAELAEAPPVARPVGVVDGLDAQLAQLPEAGRRTRSPAGHALRSGRRGGGEPRRSMRRRRAARERPRPRHRSRDRGPARTRGPCRARASAVRRRAGRSAASPARFAAPPACRGRRRSPPRTHRGAAGPASESGAAGPCARSVSAGSIAGDPPAPTACQPPPSLAPWPAMPGMRPTGRSEARPARSAAGADHGPSAGAGPSAASSARSDPRPAAAAARDRSDRLSFRA